MFRISKDFSFSASHQLMGLAENHPCSKLHGHNYIVRVLLKSDTLNEVGFVEDYRDLSDIKDYIDKYFDHQHLNDVVSFNPTAENIAQFLFDKFKPAHPLMYAVKVSETLKTWAVYEI